MTQSVSTNGGDPIPRVLTADERAAVRAFLQRSEVRLSTLHRVATALLSGAGLVVLLPAIERDAVAVVLRALTQELTWVRSTLVAAVVVVLALPLFALWMLLRELTRFYFHSHHVEVDVDVDVGRGSEGSRVFIPRFTLTGLRLPTDELGASAGVALRQMREQPEIHELLVPAKDSTRARIDRQLAAYSQAGGSDQVRVEGLLKLVATRDRGLLEEAAKVEAGMARHLLRLQAIVLRYVKALLVFVVTAVVIFAAAAITGASIEDQGALSPARLVAIALLVALWAPVIATVAATPVRWVEGLLRAEGARATSVAADPELTQMERVVMGFSSLGWVLAFLALLGLWADDDPFGAQPVVTGIVVVATGGAQIAAVWRWRQRSRVAR